MSNLCPHYPPVTIHYPVEKLDQFLEIKKRNLSKISLLEELIKTKLAAATEPRGESGAMCVTEMEHNIIHENNLWREVIKMEERESE
ncbi:MAG: hypothetical protein ACE5HY_06440, partial [Candidatus Hydrothermarchaeales archaeon]